MNVIKEPLAFILPKREATFTPEEKELAQESLAPAPEIPGTEQGVEPSVQLPPVAGEESSLNTMAVLQPDVPGATT